MFKELDPLLHSQLRLAIVSFLMSNGKSSFVELKEITKATSGNLSVQLKKLEKAKYISMQRGFVNNYQHTTISITKTGISAFEAYVKALKQYIG